MFLPFEITQYAILTAFRIQCKRDAFRIGGRIDVSPSARIQVARFLRYIARRVTPLEVETHPNSIGNPNQVIHKRESESPETHVDCYAAGERGWMVIWQRWRASACAPLLRLLKCCGITPDQLTLLALVAGLAFCPLYLWCAGFALLALAGHALLDGLDGPLARHLGCDSPRGSFTDTASDQAVVVASTITLMATRTVDVVAGTIYVVLYTVVVSFSMVRNALEVPYSWLLRPRFLVYAWLAVELWWWPGSLDGVLWICNAVLAGKAVTGFLRIRRRM